MPFDPDQGQVHSFSTSSSRIPNSLGCPMNYKPNEIALDAARDLMKYLETSGRKLHNFQFTEGNSESGGKMFGILVVENEEKKLRYLAAFSGHLSGSTLHNGFVPPIFDLLDPDGFFLKEEKEISALNEKHSLLSAQLTSIEQELNEALKLQNEALHTIKEINAEKKRKRKKLRISILDAAKLDSLNHESSADRKALKELKVQWRQKIETILKQQEELNAQIHTIENKRISRSKALQKRMFKAYEVLNARKEVTTIHDIFLEDRNALPPAGTGDCAAPKLFQFAFRNDLKPIALAEFWWGSEGLNGRKHKSFYPACKSKCEPLLNHMLTGLNVDPNPYLEQADFKSLDILFEDDYIVAVNKPSGLLSTPGRSLKTSVQNWAREQFPQLYTAPVHRLDMDTSGILLIAKSQQAHKQIQKQFLSKSVHKEYYAIIDGEPIHNSGQITLPLRPDVEDRPRQVVCSKYGKEAVTDYRVLDSKEGSSRVLLKPRTGRTHQLRVHCSHPKGLNSPIVGDNLYGTTGERLMLHAAKITFTHPISDQEITIESEPPF